MEDEFRNRLESFQATLTFANDPARKAVWDNVVPKNFGTMMAATVLLVEELAEFCQKQSASIKGAAEDKSQREGVLEQSAYAQAQAMVLYFEDQNDLTSAEPFRRTLAWWQKLNGTDLLSRSQDVIDMATPLTTGAGATALAENYGISAAKIAELVAQRTDFADLVAAPAAARSARKGYTTLLRDQFAPVTAKFRDLDRLVPQFAARPGGPQFVAGWFAARQVVDSGHGAGSGGPGGGGGTPPPPTVVPTAPQNVTVTAGAAGSGAATVDSDPPAAGEEVTSVRVFNNGTLVVEVPTLPTELTGFGAGESLYITVSAVNVIGEGPQSGTVSGQAG